MPPSGKMSIRTWVARTAPSSTKRWLVSGWRRVRGRTSVQSPSSPSLHGKARPAGRVALEVGGVDLDGPDPGLRGEAVADPVVALVTAAAGLPAVVHLAGAAGLDGVGGRGVEAVGCVLDLAAVLQGREVERTEGGEPCGVRGDLSVHAQPGDPAVRVLVDPQMGEALLGVDDEPVGRVAADRRTGDERRPLHVGGEEVLGGRGAGQGDGLDGDGLRVVAAEVCGVQDDAPDDAGRAEPDEGPVVVVGGGVGFGGADAPAAAGLPAVHDLALVAEVLRVEDGGLGLEEVLPLGEELVVGRDDARAEAAVGEVDEVGEGEVGGAVVGVRVAARVRVGVAGEAGYRGVRHGRGSFRGTVGGRVRGGGRSGRSAVPVRERPAGPDTGPGRGKAGGAGSAVPFQEAAGGLGEDAVGHDADTAQPAGADHTVQGLPGVGGDLVAVEELGGVDGEGRLGGEDREVGVTAGSSMAPFLPRPASSAGAADIQRATSSREWPRRRASVQMAGRPSWREEMPPQAEAKSGVFRSVVHGEWSLTMQSIVPSASPAHRMSWLAASRIGGST